MSGAAIYQVVVPAKAGTHKPGREKSKRQSLKSCALIYRLRLWVPAFAGTTWIGECFTFNPESI
jgi:hypothetical protein